MAMALVENKPLMKGLIKPEPSTPDVSVRLLLTPRSKDMKSGLSASKFLSRKPSDEYVMGPLK